MAGLRFPIPRWGDGSLWGNGDLYQTDLGQPNEFHTDREVTCHRLSVKINYTATIIPGSPEAFRIHDIRIRVAPDRQASFTHEAFVDRTTPSERLSARLSHSGSEFIISHIQLIAQRKRKQPKG